MNEEVEQESSSGPDAGVPEEITIRIEPILGERATLHCGPEGIVVVRRGKERRYSWDEVEWVYIYLRDRDDLRFERLDVKLPVRQEPFVLWERDWTGPEPEVVTAFFTKYVGPPVLKVLVLYTGPRTVEEADRLLKNLEEEKKARRLCAFLAMALIVFDVFAVFFQDEPPMGGLFLVLIALFILAGLLKEAWRARKLRMLVASPAALKGSSAESPAAPAEAETQARRQFEGTAATTVEESNRTIDSYVEKFIKTLCIGFLVFLVCLFTGVASHPLEISSWVAFVIFTALLWVYLRHMMRAKAKEAEQLDGLWEETAARDESGQEGGEPLSDEYE